MLTLTEIHNWIIWRDIGVLSPNCYAFNKPATRGSGTYVEEEVKRI